MVRRGPRCSAAADTRRDDPFPRAVAVRSGAGRTRTEGCWLPTVGAPPEYGTEAARGNNLAAGELVLHESRGRTAHRRRIPSGSSSLPARP